jgi:hypothetical protein
MSAREVGAITDIGTALEAIITSGAAALGRAASRWRTIAAVGDMAGRGMASGDGPVPSTASDIAAVLPSPTIATEAGTAVTVALADSRGLDITTGEVSKDTGSLGTVLRGAVSGGAVSPGTVLVGAATRTPLRADLAVTDSAITALVGTALPLIGVAAAVLPAADTAADTVDGWPPTGDATADSRVAARLQCDAGEPIAVGVR